jgi:AhpC/TSA antioxidant enzyme
LLWLFLLHFFVVQTMIESVGSTAVPSSTTTGSENDIGVTSSTACRIDDDDNTNNEISSSSTCQSSRTNATPGPVPLMNISENLTPSTSSLYDIPFNRVEFTKTTNDENHETIVVESDHTIPFREVVTYEASNHQEKSTNNPARVTIVFVIRRPGCILCREHGQQLMEWYNNYDDKNRFVNMWGIIKEVHVDNVGLFEFYQQYFTFPLYRDVQLALYKAFGNRNILGELKNTAWWNPWTLYRNYQTLQQRIYHDKPNLSGNLKGEGFIQGGILLLDASGMIRYAYEESIGQELNVVQIQQAVEEILSSQSSAPESITTATA